MKQGPDMGKPVFFFQRMVMTLMLLLVAGYGAFAQLSAPHFKSLQKQEDSLAYYAKNMVNALDPESRAEASSELIPALVKALRTPGSFYYPFDSLQQISIVYPQDSSFRIFTWALAVNEAQVRFYGALQMRDSQLKLFPFFDNSQFTRDLDTVTSNKAWIGALYYNIIEKERRGKTYYTLFGWRGYSFQSNQKMLDVLTFEDGHPVFGAPLFNFEKDSVSGGIKNRFLLIYKRDGNAGLNYDSSQQMILYDHLVSLNGEPQKKYTLVPDGTYEGFQWKKGYWMHVDKVFDEVSDKPPVPAPIDFKKSILEKDTLGGQK